MSDIIGWIGTALFAVAGVMMAYKIRASFLFLLTANLLYAIVGYMASLSSLVTVSLMMAGIDLFGWFKWNSTNADTGEIRSTDSTTAPITPTTKYTTATK